MEKVGGREKADQLAGEEIYWHNDKSLVSTVPGMVGPDVKVKAPLFNLVRCFHDLVGGGSHPTDLVWQSQFDIQRLDDNFDGGSRY